MLGAVISEPTGTTDPLTLTVSRSTAVDEFKKLQAQEDEKKEALPDGKVTRLVALFNNFAEDLDV